MKKFLLMTLIVTICLFCMSIAVMAKVNVPDEIRIGLYYGSKGASNVTLVSDGGIKIGTMDSSRRI